MPHLLTLVVFILAAARVTRLLVADDITAPLRRWGARTFTDKVAVLFVCPWCMGFWVSAVAAALWWFWGDRWWLLLPALAFAISYLVGIMATRVESED